MTLLHRGMAALALACGVPMPALAVDPDRGRQLHDESCIRCHDAAMYRRPDRLVKDFETLRERVRQCELSAELLWFDEDVEDVAAYLDRTFYRFSDVK